MAERVLLAEGLLCCRPCSLRLERAELGSLRWQGLGWFSWGAIYWLKPGNHACHASVAIAAGGVHKSLSLLHLFVSQAPC